MLEILSLLSIDPALLAKVAPIVILVMGCLSGCYMILEAVSKFTKSESDDKALGIFKKALDIFKKVTDFFSANIKH